MEIKENFIYTDSFRTKDIIWDAYDGFVQAYNNYMMYVKLNRSDIVITATLDKYITYFYDEVRDIISSFPEMKEYNIEIIFEKKEWTIEDYIKIRRFFSKFMIKSGIKNIVKEKDDVGKAVKDNR